MKVVCDVCGTTFPETDSCCPVCGCAKAPDAQLIEEETPVKQESAGSYSKGGRFSQSNVNRRSTAAEESAQESMPEPRPARERKPQSEPQGTNKGLIAAVIILLVAIVLVVVYIGISVLNMDSNEDPQPSSSSSGTVLEVPCESLTLKNANGIINLSTPNATFLLEVIVLPTDTTDKIVYSSADPTIASVDAKGNVMQVGYGETVITVACGDQMAQCTVKSTVGEPPETQPTTPPGPQLPDGFKLKLKTYKDSGEITIAGDAVATIYSETMGVKASDITWTTSDPAIATVENGKVTGVGKGYCYVTASIGDQTATCKVICTSNAAPPSDYKISHVDVTIAVGETFNLSLKNKETGANVQGIEWQVSEPGFVTINGNKITGQAVNWSGVKVFVEYEGVTYTCRIIVKPAA
ncbi:MAG: hypothetical protein E7447_03195 [Ruminococcaceae bacterium]|nr:hypothetical protein [Oscillospiraceae bacterium]